MAARKLWLAVWLVLASSSLSAAGQAITWVKNNAPPFYLINDPDGETGFGDRVQTLLESAMPQYAHQTIQMPLTRLEQSWERYAPLCFATMISEPPLNNHYQLSIPYAVYLPHGLISTRAFARTLSREPDGSVSLERLLSEQTVNLGHIAGRTYGSRVDLILKRHEAQVDMVQRVGANETAGALAMLQHNRFDLIIEYGFVLNHVPSDSERYPALVFTPIAETRGMAVLGAVGCTNSPAGHAALQDINVAISKMVQSEEYLRAVSRWLVPATEQTEYWRLFDERIFAAMETAQ
ncbi:MAG: TIGR02285 family protein [Pseudomonadaceae bacterium]